MAPDIRSAERDLRDIDTLEKKGATGAGKLEDHEALQPRLDNALKRHNEDTARFRALEQRVTTFGAIRHTGGYLLKALRRMERDNCRDRGTNLQIREGEGGQDEHGTNIYTDEFSSG